ncbi:hypothetical protein DIPPA_65988, partial [Diplonema papillatum]
MRNTHSVLNNTNQSNKRGHFTPRFPPKIPKSPRITAHSACVSSVSSPLLLLLCHPPLLSSRLSFRSPEFSFFFSVPFFSLFTRQLKSSKRNKTKEDTQKKNNND